MDEQPIAVKPPPDQIPVPHIDESQLTQNSPPPVEHKESPPSQFKPVVTTKTDHSVTIAIIATVVIVVVLSILAVFAYLNQK